MLKKKKTLVLPLNLQIEGRYLFISDIHGSLDLLKMALEEVKFNSSDVLFLIGDIIEKGQENIAILDYLMELKKSYKVYFLAGNCDEVLRYIIPPVDKEAFLFYAVEKKHSIINEMASILNIDLNKDIDVDSICSVFYEKFKKYYDFVDSFYDVIILNNKYVLVHGGLDDIENIPYYNASLLKYDSFYLKAKPTSFVRIVGHFPVVNYTRTIPCNNPIIDLDKGVISIDGGNNVKPTGQLNVLILKDNIFSYIYVDKYVKQICKTDVLDANINPIHTNSYLEKITYKGERLGDFYVCYNSKEEKCYAYKTNIIESKNNFFCYDATNYFIPLKKGERYSLIIKAQPFSIIKHEGYIGLVDTKLVDNDEL